MKARILVTLSVAALGAFSQAAPAQSCPSDPLPVPSPFTFSSGSSHALDLDGDVLIYATPVLGGATWPSVAAVFERDQGGPGAWGQVTTLRPLVPGTKSFGWSVAVCGDTIVVGSSLEELVYVHYRDLGGPSNWGLVKTLPSQVPYKSAFGTEVAIDGDTLAATADQAISDFVKVYDRNLGGPDSWGHHSTLLPPTTTSFAWGSALSISGDTLVVGDYLDDEQGPRSGAVTVYERVNDSWQVSRRLRAPADPPGQQFGSSVAVDGDVLLVGARNASTAGPVRSGAVWVFERDLGGPGHWGECARLEASDPLASAGFGGAVALSGEFAIVGARGYTPPSCTNLGRAYFFARDLGGSDAWGEVALLPAPAECGDNFGATMALSGRIAVIGSPNTEVASGTGIAYVYDELTDGCAVPYCTAGTSASGCRATMAATGTASASSATGFVLTTSRLEGLHRAAMFFGTDGALSRPWGKTSSVLCVLGPHTRTPTQNSGGTPSLCDGSYDLDFNAWMAAHPMKAPPAGSTVYAQTWYADDHAGTMSSLSNAIQFPVGP